MAWTLEQLRVFVLSVEKGGFSAAARARGSAQSAVSTAVSLLEADLGLTLFDRSTRSPKLTSAGEIVVAEAREVLRQADLLSNRALSLVNAEQSSIALAIDEALPYSAISTLVRELATRYPDLDVTFLYGSVTDVISYLRSGTAELAFHFARGELPPGLDQRQLGSLPQGVFVSMDHPIVTMQPVDRRELARHRQIVMHADGIDEPSYSPKTWRSDSFYSIAEMVADELGWAVLPANIAADEKYGKPLVQVDCPMLSLPMLQVRAVWPEGKSLNGPAAWTRDRLAELIQLQR